MDRTAEWEGPMASKDKVWLSLDIRRRAGRAALGLEAPTRFPRESSQC